MARGPVVEHTLERYARAILQGVVGVDVIWHDRQQSNGLCDAKILYEDRTAYVETVIDVDAREIAMWRRLKNGGSRLPSPVAGISWLAWMRLGARVDRIVERLPPLLVELVAEGVCFDEPVETEALQRIGVVRVSGWWTSDGAPDVVALAPDAFYDLYGSGEKFSDWVDGCLDQLGRKIDKLNRTGADERHLFVWTADIGHAGEFLQNLDEMPPRAPQVPDGLTHLWLASTISHRGALRWDAGDGWQIAPWSTPSDDIPD